MVNPASVESGPIKDDQVVASGADEYLKKQQARTNTNGATISAVRGCDDENYDSDDADLDAMMGDFSSASIFSFAT